MKNLLESIAFLANNARQQKLPSWLFVALCFNVILAPVVLAASDGAVNRGNAYALGLLGLVTVSLGIYLFVVILQPERF